MEKPGDFFLQIGNLRLICISRRKKNEERLIREYPARVRRIFLPGSIRDCYSTKSMHFRRKLSQNRLQKNGQFRDFIIMKKN